MRPNFPFKFIPVSICRRQAYRYLHLMKPLALAALLFFSFSAAAQPYFQQRVDTRLSVRLDDQKHFLHGFEQLHYTNYSPDTLRYLYLHLWPNAYRNDRTFFAAQQVLQGKTDFYFSPAEDRGYIDSLHFRVNGEAASFFSSPGYPDIARLELPEALLPGASLTIETPFRVKIPKVFSRLGHSGQAYYISQWFPKPAVYDRQGWHPLPYSDQGEFYSEYGSYDVQITVPKNYVVLATGECLDTAEVEWWSRQNHPAPADTSHRTAQKKQPKNPFPPSSTEWKTLHFRADSVHDFAWFADKRFLIQHDTLQLSDGRIIQVYVAFLPSDRSAWKGATAVLKKTMRGYGNLLGTYPYASLKAVAGNMKAGGGMEYPTICIIDRSAGSLELNETLVHEAGHNWFYGILGNNERDYPWMDEGCNSFAERKVENSLRREKGRRGSLITRLNDELYYQQAATRRDQNLQLSSAAYTALNYGADVYYKSALFLNWLEASLGDDTMRQALHGYYEQWKFRHPGPADFRNAMEAGCRRSLAWFFDGAMKTSKGVDFAVKQVKAGPDHTIIRLRNRSDFAAPAGISAYRGDSLLATYWTAPFRHDTIISVPTTGARRWQIADAVPDYFSANNQFKQGALFHGRLPRLGIGLGLNHRKAPTIYALPALGYNRYDGFMAGLLLHNLGLPEPRFRYILSGMWGTHSNALVGAGSVGYWIYPSSVFQEIVPQVDVKSFHFLEVENAGASPLVARYLKLAPSVEFVFKNRSPLSTVRRSLLLKAYAIWEEDIRYTRDPNDSTRYLPQLNAATENTYGLIRYTHRNERTFNPFSYVLEGQMGDLFAKLSATGQIRIDYNVPNKSLYLRGYFGKYFSRSTDEYSDYRYWLSSAFTGPNDYLYDGTFIGRNERDGLGSQQYSMQEGAQKIATPLYGFPLGRSNNWLASLNLRSDLPLGKLPIRAYLDLSTYADAAKQNPSGNRFLYSAGFELHFLHDLLLLHVPVVLCPDYRDYLKSMYAKDRLLHSISFSVELQNLNWLRSVSGLLQQLTK